jgi:hypothetical protein
LECLFIPTPQVSFYGKQSEGAGRIPLFTRRKRAEMNWIALGFSDRKSKSVYKEMDPRSSHLVWDDAT